MTRALEQLFEKASKLSAEQQDALAARWREELEDDARWDESFASSQEELSTLAEEVRAKIQSGKIEQTEMDQL